MLTVIIGESANRDLMSAYGGPIEGNTPWLSQKLADKSFIVFENAYAFAPATLQAITTAFTDGRQLTGETYPNGQNLIDIARRAGLYTTWISNQAPRGKNDTPISALAHRADFTFFAKGSYHGKKEPFLDEVLLEPFQTQLTTPIVENGPALIVLHLSGSHTNYRKRYPDGTMVQDFSSKNFSGSLNKLGAANLGPYSASLQYTDSILESLHATIQQTYEDRPIVMIYFSDHGEDLNFKGGDHDPKYFTWPMVRIPFFIWTSSKYQNKYPHIVEQLKANKEAIFTNDLLYDLVLGMLNICHESYDEQYDISSIDYTLTKHGATIYYREH